MRLTATFLLVTRSCLGEPLSRVRSWRRTIAFERINSQSFASSEYSVSLQSLQHLQAGLLEDTRCFVRPGFPNASNFRRDVGSLGF